ncbi:lysophospholipid acyltransferase family protein [Petroclostridium sp. X23]|uniref:lysophospholipid acyltransferase family protein n=1 Tax=Petroclostridium sp. X23 TaxID=3045146 RepID=UPI0024ACE935|nr:lysophospholipid acyltransferase family protein [Petroclostridium sp. X23]WHH59464.1 lysophospholipid acyltransferase family protein [Petroclostridium sp. X23]
MFYSIVKWIIKTAAGVLYRMDIKGIKNIPTEGACIICFNHKSTFDPPIIGVFMPRQLVFMAKEELFKVPLLGSIINALGAFPVKRGMGDITAIKKSIAILNEGKVLAMYPEGTRNKNGEVGAAKPGVALIATKAKVPVIPVGVTGAYKLFSKITINIGHPLYYDEYFDHKLSMEQLQSISNNIMNHIRMLMEEN